MTKDMNVIELNGNRYDALTGAFIPAIRRTTATPQYNNSNSPAVNSTPPTHGPTQAGPASRSSILAAAHAQAMAVQKPAHKPAPANRRLASHLPANHLPAHRPQTTRTLMRHAVKAPAATPKAPIKLQPTLTSTPAIPVHTAIQTKIAVTNVNPHRSKRAQDVSRNDLVQRFRHSAHPAKPAMVAAQPVTNQVAQAAPPAPMPTSQPIAQRLARHRAPQAATPPMRAAAQPAASKPAAAPAASSHRAAEPAKDIFEHALAMATSHQQQPPKQSVLQAARRRKRGRRIMSIAASAAVFLLLVGVIAYQNRSNIQLQLASAKAGFAASDPTYKPAGFSMSKITYEPGTVATKYDRSNGKTFSVIQKKSNWDSQTLLENFVATSNESYQGYQSNGRTIYVYGSGRATWVNAGIWYQIVAENVLSNEQVVKVAASM